MQRRTILLLLAALPCLAQKETPFPPHKVVGNVHYVGSVEYAAYLVTTPKGHVLINSSFESSVPLIQASVEKLGFKFKDIKILVTSHAHGDHIAGCAAVIESAGAQLYIMNGDQDIVSSGGRGDFQYNSQWRPCKVDRVLKDKEEVKIGGTTLVARRTPGHTRGCTTWTMQVTEEGKKYDVVVVGSPNVNPGYKLVGNAKYPEIADDFLKCFAVLKSLKCDVFLGAHGNYYRMEEKYPRLGKGPNPFIDPAGYKEFVESKEKTFLEKLAAQQAGK